MSAARTAARPHRSAPPASHDGDAGAPSSTGGDTLLLEEPGGGTAASCPLCARPRLADDVRGLAWSSQHEPDGAVTWICGRCTRAELWRIETALPVVTPPSPAWRAERRTPAAWTRPASAHATERNAG